MSLERESWIVVAEAPFVPTMGGGEREHLGFVQTLAEMGMLAALVVPTDADPAAQGRSDDLDAIRNLCSPAPVIVTPRRRSARAALGLHPYVHRSRPFDAQDVERVVADAPGATGIVAFSYKVAHIGQLLQERTGLPTVVRMHNVEGRYFRSIAASSRGASKVMATVEALRIEADERRLERSQWPAGLADISRSDSQMRGRRSTVPVSYVPTFALGPGRASSRAPRERSAVPTVLFLGALDVRTNLDAVRWFAQAVWPSVRADFPEARWQVVGRAPSQEMRDLVAATDGAELHADVPDPAVYYRTAWVAVNPAVSGSGVNIKLVEYLAAAVPVVSTTVGSQGLGLEGGRDLLIADEAANFAAAVRDLLARPDEADALGLRAAETAGQILDVEQSVAALARLMNEGDEAWRPIARP